MRLGKINKLPSKNIVTNNMTGSLDFNFLTFCLFISLLLPSSQVISAPISKTIAIDGNTFDWKAPTNITTNSGQFSTDAEGDGTNHSNLKIMFKVRVQ